MKTMSIMKTLLVTAVIMISNVTISARTAESNLVYNAEEVNGVKVAETVYTSAIHMIARALQLSITSGFPRNIPLF